MLQRPEIEVRSTQFYLENGLIYFKDKSERPRLCLPSSLEHEVFAMAHDNHHHIGFHRCYQRIAETIYMHRLSRRLRLCIASCHACQQNQTKRHRPYGQLVPIAPPTIPFHTIAMDFVLALPTSIDGFDTLLTVTDKFTKRVLLIPGMATWGAREWALVLLENLQKTDWGVPRAIVSDRDAKFMSDLWSTIFMKLEVKMLTATAYHPQTDGQSERTNQSVEIALRYFCTENPQSSHDWVLALPSIQSTFNNSVNQATGHTPTEMMYGFRVREALDVATGQPVILDELDRSVIRQDAIDAVAFANAKAKIWYDNRHNTLRLNPGDSVLLQMHKGYNTAANKIKGVNLKMTERRIGPFKVISTIGTNAYKLEIPPHWRIHPVVSVTQLEPYIHDTWNRPAPSDPPPVEVDGDTEEWRSYEVEKLVADRVRNYGGKPIREYLIRWLGYGPQHGQWYGEDLLTDSPELVRQYWKDGHPGAPRAKKATRPSKVKSSPANETPRRGPSRPRKVRS